MNILRRKADMEDSGRTSLVSTKDTIANINNSSVLGKDASDYGSDGSSRRILLSRIIFVVFVATSAGVLGYISHRLLTKSEERLAQGQFEAIAERALDVALATTLRKRFSAISIATTMAYDFPDADIWPNAILPGFEAVGKSLMTTAASSRTHFGICNLVNADQLAEFEDYFYSTAVGTINPHHPNTTGMRDFDGDGVLDYGIHGFNATFQVYRETDGKSHWKSHYDIMCPYTMHTAGPDILGFNIHSFERLGRAMDEVISCVNDRSEATELNLNDCAIMTDMFETFGRDGGSLGPNAFIMQPVYPANDPNTLVAFGTLSVRWEWILEDLFTTDVNGVDLVLKTGTEVYTYRITAGAPSLLGAGDFHDPEFSEYAVSVDLYSPDLFSRASAPYTLTVYPEHDFFETYTTGNPLVATLVVVFSILFTALLFFAYDYFVRQAFHAKQAVLEAKRMYVRYVSHEVRTPMNTVCMGLALLRDEISETFQALKSAKQTTAEDRNTAVRTENPEETDENRLEELINLTDEITHNANGAVDVLNDLLNYDKIERGKLSLELDIVRIWRLIAHTANEFQVHAAAQKIRFLLDMDEIATDPEKFNAVFAEGVDNAVVVGDPVKLAQCVRNLVSNALKFTPEEGNLTIRAKWLNKPSPDGSPLHQKTKTFELYKKESVTLPSTGMLELSVSDSGAGMTEAQLADLFQEGVQFNVNKLQCGQGSGLGLFITKGIVQRHGGSLTVNSEGLGKGTTFTLTLPLYLEEQCEPATSTDVSSVKESLEERDHHILVADDAAVNRKLLMRLLTRAGHSCVGAEDGREALDQVESAMKSGVYYDTILLDYEMPNMNGPTAAEKMRKLGCDSMIIGLTGNLMREDIEFFKSKGANGVLAKPFKMKDLVAFWNEHMG
mmetsp:Transcript_4098/g.9534  ORF Transcript_4098/g.9534 Transcript_4098/m.9534 type:complete len:897 (+) Transcript_4098:306-2996(+)